MRKFVTTREVDVALRTLGPDEVRRVRAWFGHLANWDGDAFVRENSHALPGIPDVLVLWTNTDIRIFFTVDEDTITVVDVAKKQAIVATAAH